MEEFVNEVLESPEAMYAMAVTGTGVAVHAGRKAVDSALDHLAEARYDTPSHTKKDLEDAEGVIDSYLASRQEERWEEEGLTTNPDYRTENDVFSD